MLKFNKVRIVTFISFFSIITVCLAQANKDLTFYASFNKGIDAEYAKGKNKALFAHTTLTDGHYEKGLRVSPGGYLRYPATDNLRINLSSGTISIWVKMDKDTEDIYIDPSAKTKKWLNHLFNIEGLGNGDRFHVSIGENILFFQTADSSNPQKTYSCCMSYWKLNWEKGEWHQIVITWEKNGKNSYFAGFYIDGKRNNRPNEKCNMIFPSDNPLWLNIGCYKIDSKLKTTTGNFMGVIDELRIYNRQLTAKEIKEMFSAGI
jgi:concanavalin A-like lectin/glucanase superfamily protein